MKVSIPHMGAYSELIQKMGNDFNWEIIPTQPPTDRTVELGAKYMNELMCLPAKVTLGNMIEACEKGAEALLMFDSCGECRLKTYWVLQQRVLQKLGYPGKVYPIRLGRHTPGDLCAVDPSLSYWKVWWVFIKILKKIKQLDSKLWYDILPESTQTKVGIVGEIFTILEETVNRNLIHKMEKMGVLISNSLPLSYFIFKDFYSHGWMKRPGIDRKTFEAAKKQAHKYFPKEIGGHANESIIHTIYYALSGYDGVLHILPFPCMPESTVAVILDDIAHDYQIAMMRLIFDVQTGEAGMITRLEAFVDMLRWKRGGKT